MLIILEHPVQTLFVINLFLNIYYKTRQTMYYGVTLRRVRATIVVVENQ